uniref:Uncharacterized protein n=1 Tax=Pararge aegeria TaxID=116150 RepID=S4PLI1_9NEOP
MSIIIKNGSEYKSQTSKMSSSRSRELPGTLSEYPLRIVAVTSFETNIMERIDHLTNTYGKHRTHGPFRVEFNTNTHNQYA